MPSQRQIDANRRNAKKSTGAQTPEGRAAVRSNFLRHGLTAQTAVLANENREHFDEMLEAFQAEYRPAGPTENLLVHQMVMAAWRLPRMRGIETGLFNLGISDLHDDSKLTTPASKKTSARHLSFGTTLPTPAPSKTSSVTSRASSAHSIGRFTSYSGFAQVERPFMTQPVATVRARKQILQIKANPRIGHRYRFKRTIAST
jgi:hypothetical protein